MKPETLARLLSDRLPNFQELKAIAPHNSSHLLHFTAAEGDELIHYAGKLAEGRSLTYREFKREPLPEFASLPHSILRWNGLNIGVDYLPGAVRFPNRVYAKKLRAGYGRIHGLRGEDGRSPRCFLYPGLLKQQPEGSDRVYLVEQEDFDGNSQIKYLVGYPSQSEAKAAYLQEMPEGFLKELREVAIDDLEEYRRRSDFEADFAEDEWRIYFFFGRRTGVIARSIEEARKKLKRGGDKLVKVRSLTEAERKTAARGDWVRTGANHEPPGYPGKRGLGPKPKNYEEEDLEEFAEPIAKGSTVYWNYGKGTGKGKVVKIYREAIALTLQGTEIKRNGTEDNPALLIEQEDGARVLKLLSEVKRSSDYAEREESFDFAKARKSPECKKGTPCPRSNPRACISPNYTCRIEQPLSKENSARAKRVKEALAPALGGHQELIDRGRQIMGDRVEKLNAILAPSQKLIEIDQELDRIYDDNTPEGIERETQLLREHGQETKRQAEQADRLMLSLRKELLQGSRLTAAEARKLANETNILRSAEEVQDPKVLRSRMAEFHRMTNGKAASTLRAVLKDDRPDGDRAFADEKTGVINIGRQESDTSTHAALWHEMGHHVEFGDSSIKESMYSWQQSRASGAPRPLNEIVSNGVYDKDEIAVPDQFTTPYVGRFYEDRATEVFSVGIEHFISPRMMSGLFRRDPEHFMLILGAIAQ